MHLKENEIIKDIDDKFAIFYLDFSGFNENKDSIESFIKDNKSK